MPRINTLLRSVKVRSTRFAVAATVAATGIAFVTTSGAANAYNICTNAGYMCLNAWGGGPEVTVYSPRVANDNFTIAASTTQGYDWLKFVGSGSYNNACVSDFSGLQSDAKAGLVSCGGTAGTPWGANFAQINCNTTNGPGLVFNNIHWSAYLGPKDLVKGQPFYLNKPTGWCFLVY